MQNPDDMEWMDYPESELHLTLEKLEEIRQHLFSGAAAATSGRLSDCELVQLLVVSTGEMAWHHCTWIQHAAMVQSSCCRC